MILQKSVTCILMNYQHPATDLQSWRILLRRGGGPEKLCGVVAAFSAPLYKSGNESPFLDENGVKQTTKAIQNENNTRETRFHVYDDEENIFWLDVYIIQLIFEYSYSFIK